MNFQVIMKNSRIAFFALWCELLVYRPVETKGCRAWCELLLKDDEVVICADKRTAEEMEQQLRQTMGAPGNDLLNPSVKWETVNPGMGFHDSFTPRTMRIFYRAGDERKER